MIAPLDVTIYPRGQIGDTYLAAWIGEVFSGQAIYGARRVCSELRARGIVAGRARVTRLMSERDMCGARDRIKNLVPVDYAPRLVRRGAIPDAIDRVWVADITPIKTLDGWLHLAAILDLRSRCLVGWELSINPDARLTLAALACALEWRSPAPGLIFHSDRGVQYSALAFAAECERLGFRQSMSRTGNCHDNAWIESFFASLKREIGASALERAPMALVRSVVIRYLAAYNSRRRHSTLGYYTPAAFEALDVDTQTRLLLEAKARNEATAAKRAATRAAKKAAEAAALASLESEPARVRWEVRSAA